MKDSRLDLSPLDPSVDKAWNARVSDAIMVRVEQLAAGTPLAPMSSHVIDPIAELLSLARPALLAASVIATLALLQSGRHSRPRASSPAPTESRVRDAETQFPVASAVGLAGPWARWVEEGRSPSAGEVLAAARGY